MYQSINGITSLNEERLIMKGFHVRPDQGSQALLSTMAAKFVMVPNYLQGFKCTTLKTPLAVPGTPGSSCLQTDRPSFR